MRRRRRRRRSRRRRRRRRRKEEEKKVKEKEEEEKKKKKEEDEEKKKKTKPKRRRVFNTGGITRCHVVHQNDTMPRGPLEISNGLAWIQTPASARRRKRLTAQTCQALLKAELQAKIS